MTMTFQPEYQTNKSQSNGSLIASGFWLGMGFAGFFDGIVLHQILQWHHMLTSVRPINSIADLEANTLWDGLFHVGAFIFTLIGLVLLWRSRDQLKHSTNILMGSILIGAGSFNLIEGVINHHILQIHHVKPGANQLSWDLGFLAIGALLAIIGYGIVQTQKKVIARSQSQ